MQTTIDDLNAKYAALEEKYKTVVKQYAISTIERANEATELANLKVKLNEIQDLIDNIQMELNKQDILSLKEREEALNKSWNTINELLTAIEYKINN